MGLPVAWYAIVVYTATALCFAGAARLASQAGRLAALRAACVLVLGSLAWSLWMALVSAFILHTVCLVCSALYLLTLALAAVTWKVASPFPPGDLVLGRASLARVAVVATILTAAVAAMSGPWARTSTSPGANDSVSLEQIRESHPDFLTWYLGLPRRSGSAPASDTEAGDTEAGDTEAVVTIVEFSDFLCVFCRRNAEMLSGLLERRSGQLRLLHRHFPLDTTCNDGVSRTMHPFACHAAEAAECAGEQGRYDEMSTLLFADQDKLLPTTVAKLAAETGLDSAAWQKCMDSGRGMDRVTADARAGIELGVSSTPTMFFNGRRIEGAFDGPGGYDLAVLTELALLAQKSQSPAD
ncbi:MAG: thioredoxin domain-containing protein [Proteobacteria bacterium]|nr:thioredoxin domain-containing protein [Pseudomonadota bacterium]